MFPNDTRILLIDDMTFVRSTLKKELRTLGFSNFVEANNGQRAWEILNEQYKNGLPVQLVLSDWNMPEMTGIELLRKVRGSAELQTLPFMLITAEGEAHQVKEAIGLQVDGYLKKPFTPASLKEHLGKVFKATQAKAASAAFTDDDDEDES